MISAKCIRECIWQGRHWKPGEKYEGAATPPNHFEVLKRAARNDGEAPKPTKGKKGKSGAATADGTPKDIGGSEQTGGDGDENNPETVGNEEDDTDDDREE